MEKIFFNKNGLNNGSKNTPVSLRSYTTNEIISTRPGFFSRFALLVIFGILVFLLVMAWFIPFPETISFRSKIESSTDSDFLMKKVDSTLFNKKIFFVKYQIPQSLYTKIQIGYPVQIRFDAFPSKEFGFLQGKVDFVSSSFVTDSGFLAFSLLPEKAVTNMGKDILYLSGLKCDIVIIVKDGRLLDKLYKKASQ